MTNDTIKEKLLLKSKKTKAKKSIFIFSACILLFTVISAIMVRAGYYDAIELYFSSDSLQQTYSSAHMYAMEDVFYFFLPIYFGVIAIASIIFGIVFLVLNNAYIIITNKRIIGRTSYGDKFSYDLSSIFSAKIVKNAVYIHIRTKMTGRNIAIKKIVINHVDNTKQIVDEINQPKTIDFIQEAKDLPQKYVTRFQNVTNNDKKESLILGATGVLTIVIILGLIAWFLSFGLSSTSKNKYDDVFKKDPNTWTEDEEAYVNDFFEWMGKNDKD